MRRSFFWKIYLSYAALVLVSAAIIGTLVLGNLRESALRELKNSLRNNVRLIASMEAANPAHLWSGQLARQIEEVGRETGLHLLLLFANGRAAADSLNAGIVPLNADMVGLPEFRAARSQAFGEEIRPLFPDGPAYLFVATTILHEYEIIGYVRAGLPLTQLVERHAALRNRVLMGASLNALIALCLGFFVARHVTRPLSEIGEFCLRIASGRLDQRLIIHRQDEIGVVATTINQMADDVQRRIAEETRERQRLAALLAVMADGVVAVSARQTIAYLNDVAAQLLALDPTHVKGRPVRDAMRTGAILDVYLEALGSGQRVRREVRLTGHPEDLFLRIDATSLRDEAGGPFGVLLVLHDLTEIRRLERVRRTFSANVSHELKTPLTAIGAVVDALLDDEAMDPATRSRFHRKIRDQNERIYHLVQDLLIISRLESEREVLECAALDVVPVLAECAHTFAEVATRKQIHFTSRVPAESVIVRANTEALRLIFNNLLHNAMNYTPAGGAVEIILSAVGELATVTVSDTGVGISSEHLERIFERFYRIDQARTRNAAGAGLGLSIVKHLTQVLDARVFVESRPKEGSVFTVQFQRLSPENAATSSLGHQAASASAN